MSKSPKYMPLSWLVILTYLGYIGWRLRAFVGWRIAIFPCGLLGAVDIPLFEEIATIEGGGVMYSSTSYA